MVGHAWQQLNTDAKSSTRSAVHYKARPLKGAWKVILPMVAVMAFAGCSNDAPKTNESAKKDSEGMTGVVEQKSLLRSVEKNGFTILVSGRLYTIEEVRDSIGARCTPELASMVLGKSGYDSKKNGKDNS